MLGTRGHYQPTSATERTIINFACTVSGNTTPRGLCPGIRLRISTTRARRARHTSKGHTMQVPSESEVSAYAGVTPGRQR